MEPTSDDPENNYASRATNFIHLKIMDAIAGNYNLDERHYRKQDIKDALATHHSELVFLDSEEGVARIATAICEGYPVVTDYGATFGTTFSPGIRKEIAQMRHEQEPLATVSLVCDMQTALEWLDRERLPEDLKTSIQENGLDIFAGISFIRFPATAEAQAEVGEFYVNAHNEIQVFIVENDPLMNELKKRGRKYVAVRSSNLTGEHEETYLNGATAYAETIGAPLIAIRSKKQLELILSDTSVSSSADISKQARARVGSQPIVSFGTTDTGEACVTLVRAGNTSPGTMQRLLRDFLGEDIKFQYSEEKKTNFSRQAFEVSEEISQPSDIKQELLKASLLI